MPILVVFVPGVLAFLSGYFLALKVNIVISCIVVIVAAYVAISCWQEMGIFVSLSAIMVGLIFLVFQWVTVISVNGWWHTLSLGGLLR